MPLYEYVCSQCDKPFEQLLATTKNRDKVACPECGGPAQRQISTFSAQVKRTGPACPAEGACGGPGPGSPCGGHCPLG